MNEMGISWECYRELIQDDSAETELIRAGIVPEQLEYMRADERRKILLEAGLEPVNFDF